MIKYIGKRVLWMIPITVGITILIFSIMHFVPGDPAQMILGSSATEEALDAKRTALGLNDPFLVQLGNYMSDFFFHFDLGESYITNSSIAKELFMRIPRTLSFAVGSMVISLVAGVFLGVMAAIHQNKWQDTLCMALALVGVSMPSFWLALVLVLIFAVKLGWLPASGIGSIECYILPILATSLAGIAGIARQTRSSMLEVIRADYITTARAKGLKESKVIYRHALSNALIPVITVAGTQFAGILGGSLVTEIVFGIPGVGSYMMTAINNRDYPVVQACVIMLGLSFSICMLLVDILYGFVDPRIMAQYSGGAKKRKKV